MLSKTVHNTVSLAHYPLALRISSFSFHYSFSNNLCERLQDPKLVPHEIGYYTGEDRGDGIPEDHSGWGEERGPDGGPALCWIAIRVR
jgi:hypothetical protein